MIGGRALSYPMLNTYHCGRWAKARSIHRLFVMCFFHSANNDKGRSEDTAISTSTAYENLTLET
jgi:hypothetical protein